MEKIRRPTEHQIFFMDYVMLKDNLSSGKKLNIRCAILQACYLINALAVCKYSAQVKTPLEVSLPYRKRLHQN